MAILTERKQQELTPEASDFYLRAMALLDEAEVPFLVGGAYAFARYTGIVRHTKDFDVFIRPGNFDRAQEALARGGCDLEQSFPHWLGKAYCGENFVDLIFSSGNGVARVDDLWFEHAVDGEVLGRPVKLCPAEEMIWSKSLIMERERFDGADVAHVLYCRGSDLDWERLLRRFEPNGGWRVLLVHLTLFGYVYPGEMDRIPRHVLDTLIDRLRDDEPDPSQARLCRGTILSRSQYLVDLEKWGYQDARLQPLGNMTAGEIAYWTSAAAIDGPDAQH